MKNTITKTLTLIPAAGLALALSSCDVDKVEDGNLPEVKIEGETKLPDYDVEGPDVNVGKKTVEVEVPTLDVDLPEEEDSPSGAPATEPATEKGNE